MRLFPIASVVLVGLAILPLIVGATCLPSCEVSTVGVTYGGFVPAVTFAGSGSTVTWLTTDGSPHTASDASDDFCFHTSFSLPNPGSASFFVAEGFLWADSEEGLQRCEAATALPDGSTFVLPYKCLLHPNMKANLVIR